MRGVKTNHRARDVERTGRFEIFRKIASARADAALLAELGRLLHEFSRSEADRITRRWYAARREEGVPAAELANVTLTHYEKTLRRLRPYYELDFDRGRERRSARYRDVPAFRRWLGRQGKIRFRALKISFISPSVTALVQLRPGLTSERSYLWLAGNEPALTEELFRKLETALASSAGTGQTLRSRQANALYAGTTALICALAVVFRLHGLPWQAVIGAAVLTDVALALGLMALFRLAWPHTAFRFDEVKARGRGAARLYRVLYAAAVAALTLGGAWAILTSFVRIVW
jgi:hypothetical protein